MYSNFEKLPSEKKEIILKVSMDEFVKKGYHNASTDIIAKKSGISKGSVFNYFKSKKGLFVYLAIYTRKLLMDKIMPKVEALQEEDFFERIKKMVIIKYKVFMEHPIEVEFIFKALVLPPGETKDEMQKLYNKHMECYKEKSMQDFVYNRKLLEKIPLRIGVDKVIKITSFMFEQLSNKYVEKFKYQDMRACFNELIEELDTINDIIKYGVIDKK